MPRKIYDIKPPILAQQLDSVVKKASDRARSRVKRSTSSGRYKKDKMPFGRKVIIGASVALFLLCIYLFFKLPKANITIWPKVDVLSFEQIVAADKTVKLVDVEKNLIPAEYLQVTKTNSQDFPATGNASNEGRASGTITIYNKYDPPTPFTLKAGTRFISDSGKLFVSPQKIVIPAAKKVGGKITPGTVQITVQAAEGGGGYNIAPANFSVPGLKGTPYYFSIYATSINEMTGGYTSAVKKVTDDDIQSAKDAMTSQTVSDAMDELKKQISSDYILLEDAFTSSVTGASTPTKAGTVADSFNYSVTVKASALVFKKSDIEKLVMDYIVSKIPEGKTLLENDLRLDYTATKVDITGGKITLNVVFSSGVYQSINKNSMSLSLLGENAEQIKGTIDSSYGEAALRVEVKLWPFWVRSAPNKQKAINIRLEF